MTWFVESPVGIKEEAKSLRELQRFLPSGSIIEGYHPGKWKQGEIETLPIPKKSSKSQLWYSKRWNHIQSFNKWNRIHNNPPSPSVDVVVVGSIKERNESILNLWEKGHSNGAIKNAIKGAEGMTVNIVAGVVSRARGRGDPRALRRREEKNDDERNEMILNLREKGFSAGAIRDAIKDIEDVTVHAVTGVLTRARKRGDARASVAVTNDKQKGEDDVIQNRPRI
jgi:hypothetical protein